MVLWWGCEGFLERGDLGFLILVKNDGICVDERV